MKTITMSSLALSFLTTVTPALRADAVTDWNHNMMQAVLTAKTGPIITSRVTAIFQAAVFDAVNGIDRRYTPVHVEPAAPRGASRSAAVVQAAYTVLVNLYPSQKTTFDAELVVSLAAISNHTAEQSVSIVRGVQWGQMVAEAILAWRSTDGFTTTPPPFVGGSAVGEWRPTPPGFLPGAAQQFAYMNPWAINSQSQFRPAGPPALESALYASDFNETKSMGSLSSTSRTVDETLFAQFWNGNTTLYWNRIAVSLINERQQRFHEDQTGLLENAHLLALLNIAMADATISCWEAKYHYVFWRPVTAIPMAAFDGNPATEDDPDWTPLLTTPPHPEYPSAHSTVSSAGATVLAHHFGEETSFSVDSDVVLGVIRSFPSFSAALDEITNARIFGGIHYRSACDDGRAIGKAVARYILQHSLRPVQEEHQDEGHD